MSKSIGVALILLLLVLCTATDAQGAGERPTLNLFADGATEDVVFYAQVGANAPYEPVSLVTNPNTAALVVDADSNVTMVEVRLQDASPDTTVEVLQYEVSVGFQAAVNHPNYTFTPIGGVGEARPGEDFSFLSTLSYYSNYSSVQSPPRTIIVTAFDDQGPGAPATATIEFIEENLQGPVFLSSPYTASIEENAAVGTAVTSSISAIDPEGLPVRYYLSSDSIAVGFAIDGETAEVTVANNSLLDFETMKEFVLTVGAVDSHPVNPLSAESTLTVTLTDMNDNPPVFEEAQYDFTVLEESDEFTPVGTVHATDLDESDSLFYSTTTNNFFRIISTSGVIEVIGRLDYDDPQLNPIMSFTVEVTDGVNTDTTNVIIEVIDIQDERPLITPTLSTVIVDLDLGQSSISLSSDDPNLALKVEDDSDLLVNGVVDLYILLEDDVVCLRHA